VTRRERHRNPVPPFITSTLQQEASRKLGFTAQRTMAIAQALYEGKEIGGGEQTGLITYMRTDSVHVAESAQAEARQVIGERYGARYLPEQPPHYKTQVRRAQEAHEAIRPTGARRDPASLRPCLTRDELRLYTLIWQRFIASQMAPATLSRQRPTLPPVRHPPIGPTCCGPPAPRSVRRVPQGIRRGTG